MAVKGSPLAIQPKFAEQIRNLPSPLGVRLPVQRGYMIWSASGGNLGYTGGQLGDGRDIVNFLFNPTTITTDYNIGNASLQAAMMYQVPGDNGNLLSPLLMQTVSFSLYFDRTYELNYGGNSSAKNDPAVIGVQAGIYQFMQFTGVLAAWTTARPSRCSVGWARRAPGRSQATRMSTTTCGRGLPSSLRRMKPSRASPRPTNGRGWSPSGPAMPPDYPGDSATSPRCPTFS
jgi:hypothetical protein